VKVSDGQGGSEWQTEGVKSEAARVLANPFVSIATTSTEISFYEPQVTGGEALRLLKKVKFVDSLGTAQVHGYKSDQIVFNEDRTLAFIAGHGGQIHVLDMAALDFVTTVQLDGSSANITSLAVAGDWLYVAEGDRWGSPTAKPYRLMRISLDTSSDQFLRGQQQIKLPEEVMQVVAAGFLDLAISRDENGSPRYLAVTAPTQRVTLMRGNQNKGNVLVLDLETLEESNRKQSSQSDEPLKALDGTQAIKVISINVPGKPNVGKGPQYVVAGLNPGEFVVTDALDHNNGVIGLRFERNDKGELIGEAKLTALRLTPELTSPNWLRARYQLNIQRASGVVVTTSGDQEYAFVADYNMIFNDPHFLNEPLSRYQIGGKIGIIRDPFGKAGGPVFLGATTPLAGGSYNKLSLSEDGSQLWVDYMLDTPTGVITPP
jgi:hypothetical protein